MLKKVTLIIPLFILIFGNAALATPKKKQKKVAPPVAGSSPSTTTPAPAVVTPIVSGGISPMLAMQSGKYDFIHYDESALDKEYLQLLSGNNGEDRKYFLDSIRAIQEQFETFVKTTVFNAPAKTPKNYDELANDTNVYGLVFYNQLSQASMIPTPVDAFLRAINNFNQGKQLLVAKIQSIASIKDALPSQIDTNGLTRTGVPSYPGLGRVDFSKISKWYNDRLDELTEYVKNLGHTIQVPNQAIPEEIKAGSGKGLVFIPAMRIYSSKQIAEWTEEVLSKHGWSASGQKVLAKYAAFLRERIQNFKYAYGESERYRFHGDNDCPDCKKYKAMKENEAKQIVEAFWARSYLRLTYGIPICALNIKPTGKRYANAEFVFAATETLSNFREEPVCDENEMALTDQAIQVAFNIANARNSSVFHANTSFLRRIVAAGTVLSGKAELADALATILQLLAADIDEERMLLKAGGRAALSAYFKERYLANPQDKEAMICKVRNYDPQMAAPLADALKIDPTKLNCGIADSSSFSSNSLRGHVQAMITEIKIQKNRLSQAEKLQARLDAVLDIQNNPDYQNDVNALKGVFQ